MGLTPPAEEREAMTKHKTRTREKKRWVQRLRRPPGEPRCHALGGVSCAAREAAGIQAADGVDVSLGVIAQQRLQLRLQRLVH